MKCRYHTKIHLTGRQEFYRNSPPIPSVRVKYWLSGLRVTSGGTGCLRYAGILLWLTVKSRPRVFTVRSEDQTFGTREKLNEKYWICIQILIWVKIVLPSFCYKWCSDGPRSVKMCNSGDGLKPVEIKTPLFQERLPVCRPRIVSRCDETFYVDQIIFLTLAVTAKTRLSLPNVGGWLLSTFYLFW